MTLRHFHIFLEVCHYNSMTRAAEELHISQPSVSQAVRELEEHYGVVLFERLGRKLFLTKAGEELLQYTRNILSLTRQADSAMRGFAEMMPVRLGATLSVGESVFIPLLKKFKERLSGQKVFSRIQNTAVLEQLLLKDEIDLALLEGSVQSAYLHQEPFMEDELVFVDAPEHGHGGSRPLDYVRNADFFLREEGSGTRELFTSVMQSRGVNYHAAGVYNNSESIKQAVMAGFGLAALSRRIVQKEIGEGRLTTFTVEGLRFPRVFNIVYHRNKFLSGPLAEFIHLCHGFNI